MSLRVRVVAHHPAWRREASLEAKHIRDALEHLVVALHHIGSTSIPGIFAKPILDLLLEVSDIGQLDQNLPTLEGLGYECLGEYGIAGRRYFRKANPEGIRPHQLHAFKAGSSEVERHLAFRDFLIAHPELAQAYSDLKQNLADKNPDDIQAYMDGKDPFIKDHEAKALVWRVSVGQG